MRLPIIAILGLSLASPALADPLPDGLYRGTNDGVRMEMRVKGRSMSIGIGSDGCGGGVDGSFKDAGPGAWLLSVPTMPGEQCDIRIQRQGNGAMAISEGPGCGFWHGASCSFDGVVAR